jgi:cytochrome b involved in lipid metabolism
VRSFSLAEVGKHTTEKDCWLVVNGEVLDVTSFLDKHPGGKQVLVQWAGKDASEEFNMFHKKDVIAKYAPEVILGNLAK